MTPFLRNACLIGLFLPAATTTVAQETEIGRNISIELNAAVSSDAGCKLSFLVINGHASMIAKAVYETVLFDAAGQVDRLTLFDFGALPSGRPRVRQFTVPGAGCDALGQILFNGAHVCEAADLDGMACETGIELVSRTDIEVTG